MIYNFLKQCVQEQEAGKFKDISYTKTGKMKVSVYSGSDRLFFPVITYTGYNILLKKLEQENIRRTA